LSYQSRTKNYFSQLYIKIANLFRYFDSLDRKERALREETNGFLSQNKSG